MSGGGEMLRSTRQHSDSPEPELIRSLHIERFRTQDQLLSRLAILTGAPDLRLENGSADFLENFWGYMSAPPDEQDGTVLALPPDPKDFLALPTVADELRLALASRPVKDVEQEVVALLKQFELGANLANQPITSLSGGERSLIALAKAYALEPDYTGLVMASPSSWLHPDRRTQITYVADAYLKAQKPVTLLLLDGQWTDIDKSASPASRPERYSQISWRLSLTDLSVKLPGRTYPRPSPERVLRYEHAGAWIDLNSPTLIRGDNGVGKSTLALLLAGVLKPDSGRAKIVTGATSGSARLVMQDTHHQLFGMSSFDHLQYIYRYDTPGREAAEAELGQMEGAIRTALGDTFDVVAERDSSGHCVSLLHAKIALAVERLVGKPVLLILDEPSWGLSETLARLLIDQVISHAHEQGTPVAIISHDSLWLDGIARTEASLQTTSEGNVYLNAGRVFG